MKLAKKFDIPGLKIKIKSLQVAEAKDANKQGSRVEQ
jgi:hypothetical protein